MLDRMLYLVHIFCSVIELFVIVRALRAQHVLDSFAIFSFRYLHGKAFEFIFRNNV